MEQTAQNRPACRGPWRALCIALLVAVAAGLAWAVVHFATGGDRGHSASDGAQLFALTLGPIWAIAGGSRGCRCALFTRKARAGAVPDRRAWHER